MEPPSKRARYGRARHDDFADLAMPMDYNSKRTGLPTKETKEQADASASEADDDEDEIAMDPDDYAQKLNPSHKLDKSRAVADNRLKTAFELLFEKYGHDFGDTGDEVNFYTDEIEVDNGHISALIAEEDEDEDADDNDKNRRRFPQRTDEEATRGLSLLASMPVPGPGPVSVPPRSGRNTPDTRPGDSAQSKAQRQQPVVLDSTVDPAWAAPDLPDDAFSTPAPASDAIRPPRISYPVPNRSIIFKTLPGIFGRRDSPARGKGTTSAHDEDDVLVDASEPILKCNGDETPRRWGAGGSKAKETKESAGPKAKAKETNETKEKETKETPVMLPPHVRRETPIPPPKIPSPRAYSPRPPPSVGRLSRLTKETPIPPPTIGPPQTKPPATETTGVYRRNTLDPSFVFSDDEDAGFKPRKKLQLPPVAAPETPAPIQKRRGRPKGSTNKPKAVSTPVSTPVSEPSPATSVASSETKRGPSRSRQQTKNERTRPEPSTALPTPLPRTETPATVPKRRGRPRGSTNAAKAQKLAATPEAAAAPETTLPESSPPVPDRRRRVVPPRNSTKPLGEKRPMGRPRKVRGTDVADTDASVLHLSPPQKLPVRPARHNPPRTTHGRSEIPNSQSTVGGDGLASPGMRVGVLPASLRSEIPDSEAVLSSSLVEAVDPDPTGPASTPMMLTRFIVMPTPSPARLGHVGGRASPLAQALLRTPSPSKSKHARSRLGSLEAQAQALLAGDAPSPSGSLVQTPGGSLRRCGQDGFRCAREFCFKCA